MHMSQIDLNLFTVFDAIYREGGILKRLRATPLSPTVILSAHVLVKLIFTILTLAIMLWAGRHFYTRAWSAVRHRSADMNTLVATGTAAAST